MTAGMGMCTACGAGKTNDAAKTACVACVAGKFAAAGDALGCQNCAVGKYVDVVNGCSIRVPLDSIMVVSGTPDEAEACLGAVYIKTLSTTSLPAPLKDLTLNVSIWQARLLLQTLHGAMTALQVCTRPS